MELNMLVHPKAFIKSDKKYRENQQKNKIKNETKPTKVVKFYINREISVDADVILDRTISTTAVGLYTRLAYFADNGLNVTEDSLMYMFNMDSEVYQDAFDQLKDRGYIETEKDKDGILNIRLYNAVSRESAIDRAMRKR